MRRRSGAISLSSNDRRSEADERWSSRRLSLNVLTPYRDGQSLASNLDSSTSGFLMLSGRVCDAPKLREPTDASRRQPVALRPNLETSDAPVGLSLVPDHTRKQLPSCEATHLHMCIR